MKCSNCGCENKDEYTEEELKSTFPFSREILQCRRCRRPLSICGALIQLNIKEE